MRTEHVEQPGQHQLIVRPRIGPELDAIAALTEFEQAERIVAHWGNVFRLDEVEPMRTVAAMLRGTLFQQARKLGLRRQGSANEARRESNDDVGPSRPPEHRARKIARRQDQTCHGARSSRYVLRSAGFQRQRWSLVRCVPPHQRLIGL